MASRLFRLYALLLLSVYYFKSDLNQDSNNPTRTFSNLAEAFLFHQLEPLTSGSSIYPEFRENSSSSSYLSNYHSAVRPQAVNSRSAQADQTPNLFTTRDSISFNEASQQQQGEFFSCPTECQCNKETQIADCSSRNLNRVPTGFPTHVKRIRLERNNITELKPYAFQGLKRLQRIDLSNNNLLRIDPLAFSGLQSLNSLILYSNKLSQIPVNAFSELSQLQLLLLNANNLQCINKLLFQPLANLNLLSLYDNNIETLVNGTFDGLKNIKTIHLGKNPLVCDCNLRWLADYLDQNPIETSEARCEAPAPRNQGKKLSQLSKQKFKCEGNEQSRTNALANQCNAPQQQPQADSSCPAGCVCSGATVDCSQRTGPSTVESRGEFSAQGAAYELPDIPDDVPVYVTRMRINDNRIKRIRQTGLFRRLANSQKLDLGNNKIVDIEDNAINGAPGAKPERVVFILLENDNCDAKLKSQQPEDACSLAPKVNAPNFDSPCYNGGSCLSSSASNNIAALNQLAAQPAPGYFSSNYSCLCPPGFAGSLCEINIDDCADHQCQNGAMCVDGINSYKCVCRDPTTTGEFCEQLSSFSTSSANSIAPLALPIVASGSVSQDQIGFVQPKEQQQQPQQQQILARSADFGEKAQINFAAGLSSSNCKRLTRRSFYQDGNGCQSVRVLKISECSGSCCTATKVKRRRIRMQCTDGASYVKTVELIKRCECASQQQHPQLINASQDDQMLQITRLDAVD